MYPGLLYEYEEVLLGHKNSVSNYFFANDETRNEKTALYVVKFAINYYLGWTPDEAIDLLTGRGRLDGGQCPRCSGRQHPPRPGGECPVGRPLRHVPRRHHSPGTEESLPLRADHHIHGRLGHLRRSAPAVRTV